MLVSPVDFLLAILAELIDTGNLLDGVEVHLGKADIVPNRDTTIADLDECDFSGYLESAAVVWTDPFVNTANQAEIIGGLVTFAANGDTVTNTAYTYFLTDTAGTTLLWAERLATPKTFAADGDTLPILPRYTLGQQS